MVWSLLILGLIVWLIIRLTKGSSTNTADQQLEQRNYEWAEFIARYRGKVKTKAERAIVERMLADIAKQGLPVPPADATYPSAPAQSMQPNPKLAYTTAATSTTYAAVDQLEPDFAIDEPISQGPVLIQQPKQQVDSGLILLYFGAFLFLGAVGLFLAFGNLPGAAKSSLVAMLVALFYITGQWLFRSSRRLKQGGSAFIGIGLILLPFFGLSLYVDTFSQTQGPLVWAFISVVSILLYWHALLTTRQAYVTYSMLAAVVSLFESSVAITSLPVYYFALAMAVVSIIFLVLTKLKKNMQDLQEPLIVSANVLLPLSLLMSLIYLPDHGLTPVALALLLSCAFYAVYAWEQKPGERTSLIVLSNCLGLAGASTLAYSITSEVEIIAPLLVVLAVGQLCTLALLHHSKYIAAKTYSALMFMVVASGLVSCLFAWNNAALLAVIMLASAALMVSVHTLTRDPGYITAAVCMLFLWVLELGAYWQSWDHKMFVAAWAGLAILFFGQRIRHPKTSPLGTIYRVGYLIALGLIVSFGIFGGWQLAASSAGIVGLLMLLIDRYERSPTYTLVSLCLQYIALFALSFGLGGEQLTKLTYLWGGLAIVHYIVGRLLPVRRELLCASGIVGAFMAVCTVFGGPDSTVPMLAAAVLFAGLTILEYLRKQDSSYLVLSVVAQYIALAWGCALLPAQGRATYTPALFLGLALLQYFISGNVRDKNILVYASLGGLVFGASSGIVFGQTTVPMPVNVLVFAAIAFVEARRNLSRSLVTLSIVAQYVLVLWLSIWQHTVEDAQLVPAALGLYAAILYAAHWSKLLKDFETEQYKNASMVGLAAGALCAIPYGGARLPMIFSLAGLGAVIYLEGDKHVLQARRELGLAVIMVAFQWWLGIGDVNELQIYTHLWVALLVSFAVWRNGLGQLEQEKNYTVTALSVLSVPLLLQALGDSGQAYGWLLIVEHVLMMIVGISLKRRYIMWWGLAVSTVAVLYQLRDLAFVALGFLAVVVIGIALYIIGRQGGEKRS